MRVPAVGGFRRRADRDAARLVVDPIGRARRGRGDYRSIRVGDLGALFEAALLLDGLEHRGSSPSNGDEVGVLLIDLGHLSENLESDFELRGVDAAGFSLLGGHTRFYAAAGRATVEAWS